MTDKDMERLTGEKVTAKHQMLLVGDRVFARNGPNDWFECDAERAVFDGEERVIVKLRTDEPA